MNKLMLTTLATLLSVSYGVQADNVIADDLIVQGSGCFGFDCVNNESFDFDTLRLKENNTRIKFEDTSVGTFPTTDWQLTANDSASGGASKFSIEDITGATIPFTIMAGAPSNSLFVDSSGNIGLHTSVPAFDLHLLTPDTPGVRLEQSNASGFTAQTWDVAGNEANFFIRDVTGSSNLPFRIRPGAPTSSIDIAATGNVGINTASPATKLHIMGSAGESSTVRLESLSTAPAVDNKKWDITTNKTTGQLTITDDTSGVRSPFKIGVGAIDNLLLVGAVAPNRLDIMGSLYIQGKKKGPDYVFTPGYELLSIDSHAKQMWKQKHLPKLSPAETPETGERLIDIGERSHGTLEELEIAHIYIQQLHKRIEGLEERLARLESK